MFKTKKEAKTFIAKLHKKVNGKKLNLSEFKKNIAACFSKHDISELYEDDTALLQDLKDNYISILDDPRVTIDTAKEYLENINCGITENYENAWCAKYIEEKLPKSDTIAYPITKANELSKRCEEILAIFHFKFEAEYNIQSSFWRGLFKSILNRHKERVNFTSESRGMHGNPEMIFAKNTINDLTRDNLITALPLFYVAKLDFENDTSENGFYYSREKLSSFLNGVLWTQTNNGYCTHQSSRKEANDNADIVSQAKLEKLFTDAGKPVPNKLKSKG